MSAVRMCDRDGAVFSERAEGWGTFTGSTTRRNERTGRMESITETLDLCPQCNAPATVARSVAAIPSVPAAERLADINGGAIPNIVEE